MVGHMNVVHMRNRHVVNNHTIMQGSSIFDVNQVNRVHPVLTVIDIKDWGRLEGLALKKGTYNPIKRNNAVLNGEQDMNIISVCTDMNDQQ